MTKEKALEETKLVKDLGPGQVTCTDQSLMKLKNKCNLFCRRRNTPPRGRIFPARQVLFHRGYRKCTCWPRGQSLRFGMEKTSQVYIYIYIFVVVETQRMKQWSI